jgi:hypothetical protein
MSLVLTAAAFLAWAYLALARGMFWRASERLTAAPAPESWPQVVAIIPARDEADCCGAIYDDDCGFRLTPLARRGRAMERANLLVCLSWLSPG